MSTMWPAPHGTRCDFCMAEAPLCLDIAPAARIVAELTDSRLYIDNEDWGACAECAALIADSRWLELLDRGIIGVMAFWNTPNTSENYRDYRAKLSFTLQGVFGSQWPDELCLW